MVVVSYFNTRYHEFVETLRTPREAARKLCHGANLADGIRSLLIFSFISGFICAMFYGIGGVLGSLVEFALGASTNTVVNAAIFSLLVMAGFIVAFIPLYISLIVSAAVFTGFIWVLSKLFGSKAHFGELFGALVPPFNTVLLTSAGITALLGVVVQVVAPLSADIGGMLGLLSLLPALLLCLYLVVLWVIFTAAASGIQDWKAAVSVLIPLSLALLVITVIVVIVSTIAGSFGGLGSLA